MLGNEYFGTVISPFLLNSDAMALVSLLFTKFNKDMEERAVILLNAAELHPGMSAYQLSLTHKALGDVYYSNAFFGAALEHYKRGLNQNPALSVKKRIKELEKRPDSEMAFSASPDLIGDVLRFPKYKKMVEAHEAERRSSLSSIRPVAPEIRELSDRLQQETRDNVARENDIYDPAFEAAVDRVLASLGEAMKDAFHKNRLIRQQTENSSFLSSKETDILELRAMVASAVYHGDISKDCGKNLTDILDGLAAGLSS